MELPGFEPRSSIFIPVICPLWKWINLNLFHYSEYRNLKEVIQSSQLIVYQLTYNSKNRKAFRLLQLLQRVDFNNANADDNLKISVPYNDLTNTSEFSESSLHVWRIH